MKTRIFRFVAMTVVSLCAMSFFHACNKSNLNPKEEDYSSCDFELKVSEQRHSKTFEWEVIGNKISINPTEQELQELWVTKWNTVTVTALPKPGTFQGVNYSSSNAKAVKVSKIDDTSCTIEYVGDSDSPVTITAKAGTFVHTFQVYSKEVIKLEGIHIYIDGEDRLMKMRSVAGWCLEEERVCLHQGPQTADWHEVTLSIGKLEPENASFRYVVEQTRSSSHDLNGNKDNFLENKTSKKDFSYYQGLTGQMKTVDVNIAIIFDFNTDTIKPENKKIKETAIVIYFNEIK